MCQKQNSDGACGQILCWLTMGSMIFGGIKGLVEYAPMLIIQPKKVVHVEPDKLVASIPAPAPAVEPQDSVQPIQQRFRPTHPIDPPPKQAEPYVTFPVEPYNPPVMQPQEAQTIFVQRPVVVIPDRKTQRKIHHLEKKSFKKSAKHPHLVVYR